MVRGPVMWSCADSLLSKLTLSFHPHNISPLFHLPPWKTLTHSEGLCLCLTLLSFFIAFPPLMHTSTWSASVMRMVVSQLPVNHCDKCVCWQVGHPEAKWFSLQGRERHLAQRLPAGHELCYWNLNPIQADSIISFPWVYVCIFRKIIA